MGNWKWVYRPKDPEKIAKLVQDFGENWAAHPTLTAVKLEFTQEELNRHWRWMLSRKQLYEQVLSTKRLLPKAQALASGGDFECDYCSYQEECVGGQV